MLYNANDLQMSVIDEAMTLLEGANYLTESESRYYPEMVPIRENDRLGYKLMRIEDLVEYSLANGITDSDVMILLIDGFSIRVALPFYPVFATIIEEIFAVICRLQTFVGGEVTCL